MLNGHPVDRTPLASCHASDNNQQGRALQIGGVAPLRYNPGHRKGAARDGPKEPARGQHMCPGGKTRYLGLVVPNLNPDCKCCVQGCLMKAVKAMHVSLEKTQVCDARGRAVAIYDKIVHLMNDPRQPPSNIYHHLVAQCRQADLLRCRLSGSMFGRR